MTESCPERRKIIRRLIKKLTPQPLYLAEDYLTASAKFTGLQTKVVKYLQNMDVFPLNINPVDRSVIYNKLVHFYTVKNKIPSSHELFESLYLEIPHYMDIGSFRKLLIKMGFVWKKVNPMRAVVIEDPSVRFERYNYLKKIQAYRATSTDIYYIDAGSFDDTGNFRDCKLTNAHIGNVLQNEWIQKIVYALGPDGVIAFEEIDNFNPETIEEWVKITLIPRIPRPSVFILKNLKHQNEKLLETPSLDSLKSDIKRWLDRHDIIYDPEISKYELYAIAEKCTDLNHTFYRLDEVFKSHGHIVLRIPKCIENVNSAALLARIVNGTMYGVIKDNASRILQSKDLVREIKDIIEEALIGEGLAVIDALESYTSREELELIEMDDKVDKVYDNIFMKTIHGKWSKEHNEDSDLPSCSDSE